MELDSFLIDYANTFPSGTTPQDVIKQLVGKRVIDKLRVRNAMIIREFDQRLKRNDSSITDIYHDLEYKYNIGYDMVRKIIAARDINSF